MHAWLTHRSVDVEDVGVGQHVAAEVEAVAEEDPRHGESPDAVQSVNLTSPGALLGVQQDHRVGIQRKASQGLRSRF